MLKVSEAMDAVVKTYSNPLVLIPMAAMFVIIFGIVLRSLREMPLFEGGAKVVIALCVTILAMYGMDQTLVRLVVGQYTAMGVVMLFCHAPDGTGHFLVRG